MVFRRTGPGENRIKAYRNKESVICEYRPGARGTRSPREGFQYGKSDLDCNRANRGLKKKKQAGRQGKGETSGGVWRAAQKEKRANGQRQERKPNKGAKKMQEKLVIGGMGRTGKKNSLRTPTGLPGLGGKKVHERKHFRNWEKPARSQTRNKQKPGDKSGNNPTREGWECKGSSHTGPEARRARGTKELKHRL